MGRVPRQAKGTPTGSFTLFILFGWCCAHCAGHGPTDPTPGAPVCASLLQDRAVSSRVVDVPDVPDVPDVVERGDSSKGHGRGSPSMLEVARENANRTMAEHDPAPAIGEAADEQKTKVVVVPKFDHVREVLDSSKDDAAPANKQKTYIVVVPKFDHEREGPSATAGTVVDPHVQDADGIDDTPDYDFMEVIKTIGYFLMALFVAYGIWFLTCRSKPMAGASPTPPPTPEDHATRDVADMPALPEPTPSAAGAARLADTGQVMGASGPVGRPIASLSSNPSFSQLSSAPAPPAPAPPPPEPVRVDNEFVSNVNRTFTYITEGHSLPSTSQNLRQLQPGPFAIPQPLPRALPPAPPSSRQALLAPSRILALPPDHVMRAVPQEPVMRAASMPPSRLLVQEPAAVLMPPPRIMMAAPQEHTRVLSPLRVVSSPVPPVRPAAAAARARTMSPVPQSRTVATVMEPTALIPEKHSRLGQESHFAIRSLRGMDLKQMEPTTFDVLDVEGQPVLRAHVVLPQNWHMDPGSDSWHSSRKLGATRSPTITLSKVLTNGSGELQAGPPVACCRAGGEVDGRKSMYVYDSEDELFAVISRDASRRRYVITSTRLGLDLFFEGSFNARVSITNGHGEQIARTQAATKDAESPVLSYWLHIAPHASSLETLAICGLISIEVDEVEL